MEALACFPHEATRVCVLLKQPQFEILSLLRVKPSAKFEPRAGNIFPAMQFNAPLLP
jgi:hypothetical protein